MNTAKQINVMIGLLFVGLVGTFLYFLFDNGFSIAGFEFEGREEIARQRQELVNSERGGFLYARNCRSCHGLYGKGAIEQAGLPGAPLNDEGNRAPALTASQMGPRQARLSATIHCGRVGTVMPPWSLAEGGPLNDFQIEQIVTLITSDFSLEGWAFAVEEANHGDAFVPAKHLAAAASATDTTLELDSVAGLEVTPDSELLLRIGGMHLDDPYEIVKVLRVNEDDNTIRVERGTTGTKAVEHAAGVEVFNGPIPPGDQITGATGTPPCGQKAPAATPAAEPDQVALADATEIEMGDNFFAVGDARNPTLTAAPGESVEISLTNAGQAVHNMVFSGPDGELGTDDDVVSEPDVITAGGTGTITITVEATGTFPYNCAFHPAEMAGEIVVQ